MFYIIIKNKYKVIMVAIVSLALSGCLGSLSKSYEEGKAATISAYNSTKGTFEDKGSTGNKSNNNNVQATATQETAAKNKPAQNNNITPKKITGTKDPQFKYLTIESPDPESIHSLEYPSYKGLYLDVWTRWLTPFSYRDLLNIQDHAGTYSKEKIIQLYTPRNGRNGSVKVRTPADYVHQFWFRNIGLSASNLSTYPVLKKYICSEKMQVQENACATNYRGKNVGFYAFASMGSSFDQKRAVKGYVQNEFDKFLKMANKASHTIYVQGEAYISSYNFDMGGYMLSGIEPIDPETKKFWMKGRFDKTYTKKYSIFTKKSYNGINGHLYKMSPAKAQEFSKKIKEMKKGLDKLYFVYKVKLKKKSLKKVLKTGSRKPKTNDQMMSESTDILSDNIDFFHDKGMKHKAFSLPVNYKWP